MNCLHQFLVLIEIEIVLKGLFVLLLYIRNGNMSEFCWQESHTLFDFTDSISASVMDLTYAEITYFHVFVSALKAETPHDDQVKQIDFEIEKYGPKIRCKLSFSSMAKFEF